MSGVKLTFLGTGTSQGIPIIGCDCPVCRSNDPRDKRLRAAALFECSGLNILVDAGPDFRTQMIRAGVRHLDGILLTHNHMDHVGGLDDVRALNYIDKKPAYIYCEPKVVDSLRIMYSYAFAEHKYPGAPEWRVKLIGEEPFTVTPNNRGELVWMHDLGYCTRLEDGSVVPCGGDIVSNAEVSAEGVKVIPIRGYHDAMPVLGFRIGDIAYITDISRLGEGEKEKLVGLKHLTLNTVSYKPHHSHLSLSEAVALAQEIGAEHTWLTHLSHTFPTHGEFRSHLPEGIAPAWDGLVISD